MGLWGRLFGSSHVPPRSASSSSSRTEASSSRAEASSSVTVAHVGGNELRSDGSMTIDLPGPVDIDTQGRTSISVGGGLSIRSDGTVNIDFNSSFGAFKSPFDN